MKQTKTDNYWLAHGDCRELVDLIEENSVHSCVTDPPYGMELDKSSKGYGTKDYGNRGFDVYNRSRRYFAEQSWDSEGVERDVEFWRKIERVLRPGGYLLSFGGSMTSHRIASAIEDAGFTIKTNVAWVYMTGYPHHMAIGDEGWGRDFKPAYEPIIVAQKKISEKTKKANFEKWKTGGINVDGCRLPDNRMPTNVIHDGALRYCMEHEMLDQVFYEAKPTKQERDDGLGKRTLKSEAKKNHHPSVKPVKLMERLIRFVTYKGGTVLDPFMGSGTTGKAAVANGWKFIGFERDEKFFDFCQKRIEHEEKTLFNG